MIHIHRLGGCAPTPLAHYLKAIGILRLIAEQADVSARGWWDGDLFRLSTTLDADELNSFFMSRYKPTPMLSPWNKGSGFYSVKDAGLHPVEHSTAPRFSNLREGIKASRDLLDDLIEADQAVRSIKDESKTKGLSRTARAGLRSSADYKQRLAEAERRFKRCKAELIPAVRRSWRGPHRDWIDAAMVLADDDSAMFPSLLGTGGNDGRLDFTNNFLQRLGDIFDLTSPSGRHRDTTEEWIRGALWGEPAASSQTGCAVGQYLPGTAGGANNDNGPDGNSLLNPLDFLLMLEGSVLFTAHATRRLGSRKGIRAAAPFAVDAQAAGYASASGSDESARGEQWMPLWNQPFRLPELKRVLAEGRAQIGAHASNDPLDLARAIARLGTARGISSFQRYGYIERNGQSNLAVPLGRFNVPERASSELECLDDLDGWLVRIRREARSKNASGPFKQAERQLGDALLAVTQHPTEAMRWQRVLLALVGIEAVQINGSGFKAGPIPKLRPAWVAAADDGGPEIRLAVALALQQGGFEGKDARRWNSVRRHWLPLDQRDLQRFAQAGSVGHTHLLDGPERVIQGRIGLEDAVALVERRLIEATQHGQRRLPLRAAHRAAALSPDLAALCNRAIDLDRTMALARALMALNPSMWQHEPVALSRPASDSINDNIPDDAWLVLRLALLPEPLRVSGGTSKIEIRTDPAIFRRLANGDAATALQLALRRLDSVGIRAAVRSTSLPAATARRWAAALAFPISPSTATRYLRRLDPTTDSTKED
ncbi:type I-U CRISPR-associated protein Csx17 [Thiocapsa sp.]|uniref:type I-G CRISPR-associated protein Cas8g1/Csx17 n=1 Tax=Thiocapsa sp. TaxID=2024551 RepID=UPI0035939F7A